MCCITMIMITMMIIMITLAITMQSMLDSMSNCFPFELLFFIHKPICI